MVVVVLVVSVVVVLVVLVVVVLVVLVVLVVYQDVSDRTFSTRSCGLVISTEARLQSIASIERWKRLKTERLQTPLAMRAFRYARRRPKCAPLVSNYRMQRPWR